MLHETFGPKTHEPTTIIVRPEVEVGKKTETRTIPEREAPYCTFINPLIHIWHRHARGNHQAICECEWHLLLLYILPAYHILS